MLDKLIRKVKSFIWYITPRVYNLPQVIYIRYIRTGYCFDERIKKSIDDKHKKNLFKLQPVPTFSVRKE